jgi:hypothetical protein
MSLRQYYGHMATFQLKLVEKKAPIPNALFYLGRDNERNDYNIIFLTCHLPGFPISLLILGVFSFQKVTHMYSTFTIF